MNKIEKKYIIYYIIAIFIIGLVQLIDWYFGSEDPLWHLFFYMIMIPGISLLLGLGTGQAKKYYLIPIIPFIATILVYIFMGNGGFSWQNINFGIIQFGLLSSISSIIGIVIIRTIIWLNNRKK